MTNKIDVPPKYEEDYYQSHFHEYHDQTFNVDPSSFLEPLANQLEPGASVLDVGCASGRDLLWFKNRGFKVSGIERAPELARLARQNAGCEVIESDFEHFDFSGFQVDAIVLVGAMVHVPHEKMEQVLSSIFTALRCGGFVLLTLKEGEHMKTSQDGRIFYLWNQSDLENIFKRLGFVIVELSRQVSKIRQEDVWLGYVLRKKS
ncbi:MAG: class I SAM-dependent methyltransferase [Desulfobacterales bacterium]|nr:class I SAM-dependent methyltransferase [Desulfobacterales bacterium]